MCMKISKFKKLQINSRFRIYKYFVDADNILEQNNDYSGEMER